MFLFLQKADKRSLDNKVNHSLFDTTTNDINKMIKEILDKLAGNVRSISIPHGSNVHLSKSQRLNVHFIKNLHASNVFLL